MPNCKTKFSAYSVHSQEVFFPFLSLILSRLCYRLPGDGRFQEADSRKGRDTCKLRLTGGRPPVLAAVPAQIRSSVNSPLRRALLHYAVRRKQAELRSGVVRNNSLWDKLVFNKIQVGG